MVGLVVVHRTRPGLLDILLAEGEHVAEGTQRHHFLLVVADAHAAHRANDIVLDVEVVGDDLVGAKARELFQRLVDEVTKHTANAGDAAQILVHLVIYPSLGNVLDGGLMGLTVGASEYHCGKQDGKYQSGDEPRRAAAFLLHLILCGPAGRHLRRCLSRGHYGVIRLAHSCLILGNTGSLLRGLKLGTLQHGGQFGHVTGLHPVGHAGRPHFAFGVNSLLRQFFYGKRSFLFSVSNQMKFHFCP